MGAQSTFKLPGILKTFVCLTILMYSAGTVQAQGNLLITPRRILFEGQERIKEISLANISKDTATYIISFKSGVKATVSKKSLYNYILF